MSKHWDELRDKGPQIKESQNKHQRKRSGKKPFVIEHRYVGPKHGWLWYKEQREWHVYRRYKTEKQRDQALASVKRKKENHQTSLYGRWYRYWEYRVNE